MAGIYYDPKVHDWGTPLANTINQGINQGIALTRMNKEMELADLQKQKMGQDIETGKIDLERKQNIQKAGNDIAKLAADYQDNIGMLKESRPKEVPHPGEAPKAPSIPTFESPSAGLSYNEERMKAGNETPLAALQEKNAYDIKLKDHEDYKVKASEYDKKASQLGGQLDKDIMNTFLKHGLADKAQEHLQTHIKGLHDLAAVSPELAFRFAEGGPLGNLIEGVKPKGEKGVFQAAMKDGSYLIVDTRNGEIKAKGAVEGKGKGLSSVLHNALTGNNTEALFNFIRDPETGRVVESQQLSPSGQRWKGVGVGGSSEGGGSGEGGRLKGYETTGIEKEVQKAFFQYALRNVKDEELKGKISPANAFNYLSEPEQLTYRGVLQQAQVIKQKNPKVPNSVAVSEALKMDYTGGGGGEGGSPGAVRKASPGLPTNAKQAADGNWYVPDSKSKSGWSLIKPKIGTSGASAPMKTLENVGLVKIGREEVVRVVENEAGTRYGIKADGTRKKLKPTQRRSAVEEAREAETEEGVERLKTFGGLAGHALKKGWETWSRAVSLPTKILFDYEQERKQNIETDAELMRKQGFSSKEINRALREKYRGY